MACGNPDLRGKMCELGRETRKRICKRCKWKVTTGAAKATPESTQEGTTR